MPTAAPTAVLSASSSATTQIPAVLRSMWVGPKRSVPDMPSSDRYRFRLTSVEALVFPNEKLQDDWFDSLASATGPDELSVSAAGPQAADASPGTSVDMRGRCPRPASVSYLMTVSDLCTDRSSALAGDWIRVACTDTSDGCSGDLEAGTFPSQYVAPRLGPTESWKPEARRHPQDTVPDGWGELVGLADDLHTHPSTEYAKWTSLGPPTDSVDGVYVYTDPAATTQPPTCANTEQSNVKRTASGLMDWVRSRPSLVTTTPTPITIGRIQRFVHGRQGRAFVDGDLPRH